MKVAGIEQINYRSSHSVRASLRYHAAMRRRPAFLAAFVRAVASPPRGRLAPLVLDRLAARHGLPAAAIARALFPPRGER